MTEIETIKEANCAQRIIDMGKIDIDYIRSRCREDGDCWIWRLGFTSRQVPSMHAGKKIVGVRRVVAELLGMTVAGKKVTNTCGDKRCVCPDHVLPIAASALGKPSAKRTGYAQLAVRNKKISDAKRAHHSKITEAQAREVRESPETLKQVAGRLGISVSTAQRIRAGKLWKTYGATPFSGLGAR